MEEKLELNYVKHYLGTGVKFRRFMGSRKFIDQPLTPNNLIWIQDGKLLLHPLSRLTEPILEGGKRIKDLGRPYNTPGSEYFELVRRVELSRRYDTPQAKEPYNSIVGTIEYWFVEKLFEWHFDVFELIPQGLALPIEPQPINTK